MIPKTIHYCWFGGNPLPEKDRKCIESWRKMCPDYKIIRWDETNYDVSKNEYMKEAYEAKKWGFVPDFGRLDIIYNYGGIYLDTDVELVKNLDDLLECKAFMGFEDGVHVNPGLCIAAEPHHEAIKELLEIYKDRKFKLDDGVLDLTASPIMNTDMLIKMGLKSNNQKQVVNGVTIFPTDYFCPKNFNTGELRVTENTYGIHWFNASWSTAWDKRIMRIQRCKNQDGVEFKIRRMISFPLRVISKIDKMGLKKTAKFAVGKIKRKK